MASVNASLAKLESTINDLGGLVQDIRRSIVSEQRRYNAVTEALQKLGFNIPAAPSEREETAVPEKAPRTRVKKAKRDKWHTKHHKVAPLRELVESILTDGGPNDIKSVLHRAETQRPSSRGSDIKFLMKQMGNVRFLPDGTVELKKIVYTTRNERLMKKRKENREYKVVPHSVPNKAPPSPRKEAPVKAAAPSIIGSVANYLLAHPNKDVHCTEIVPYVKEQGAKFTSADHQMAVNLVMYSFAPTVKRMGRQVWRLVDPAGLRAKRQTAQVNLSGLPKKERKIPKKREPGPNTKIMRVKALLPPYLESEGKPVREDSIMRFLATHHIRYRGYAPRQSLNSMLRRLGRQGIIVNVTGQGWTTQAVIDKEKGKVNAVRIPQPTGMQASFNLPSGDAETALSH